MNQDLIDFHTVGWLLVWVRMWKSVYVLKPSLGCLPALPCSAPRKLVFLSLETFIALAYPGRILSQVWVLVRPILPSRKDLDHSYCPLMFCQLACWVRVRLNLFVHWTSVKLPASKVSRNVHCLKYFLGQRFCVLCSEIWFPFLFSPSPLSPLECRFQNKTCTEPLTQ